MQVSANRDCCVVRAVATDEDACVAAKAHAGLHTVSYAVWLPDDAPAEMHDDVHVVVNSAVSSVMAGAAARAARSLVADASEMAKIALASNATPAMNSADRRHTVRNTDTQATQALGQGDDDSTTVWQLPRTNEVEAAGLAAPDFAAELEGDILAERDSKGAKEVAKGQHERQQVRR